MVGVTSTASPSLITIAREKSIFAPLRVSVAGRSPTKIILFSSNADFSKSEIFNSTSSHLDAASPMLPNASAAP